MSLVLTTGILRVWKALAAGSVNDCICAEIVQPLDAIGGGEGVINVTSVVPQLHLATCEASEGLSPKITLNHLHWLTSGATSFARGLNDVPKMVAILLGAALLTGTGICSATYLFC